MVDKVYYSEIIDKETQGDAAAALINDNKRAVNEIVDELGGFGTAATRDTGSAANNIPLNSDLGTASTKDTGTAPGQIPTSDDLGELAYKASASIAEAVAGTANKYPDAAGVLASINENSFSDQSLELIWSGSSNTVDMSALSGGWPGDGLYFIEQSNGTSFMYLVDSVSNAALAYFSRDIGNDTANFYTTFKDSSNILEARSAFLDLPGAQITFSLSPIKNIYKVG